jgi:hypothetical protein
VIVNIPVRAYKFIVAAPGLAVLAAGILNRDIRMVGFGAVLTAVLFGLGLILERSILRLRERDIFGGQNVAEPGQPVLPGGRWRISYRTNKIILIVIGSIVGVLWLLNLIGK